MNAFIRLFIALVLLHSSIAAGADKYALLIGVTKYHHAGMNSSPLKYPEDDAAAVADLLKQAGYTVKVLRGKEATKAAIETALTQLGKEGSEVGVVLIGMFGHGVQYGQDGYFGPYDTSTRDQKDFQGNVQRDKNKQLILEPDPVSMISMRQVLDALTRSPAKNKIILADCCREDPGAARGRNAFGSNLTTADLPDGTAALFACSRNEQAFEHDDWQHGAFTKAFLEQAANIAAQGNVKAGRLAESVGEDVQSMVDDKTKGKSKQTVTYINTGIVDLQIQLKQPALPDLITNSIGMKLKLIPAGEFLMGSRDREEGHQDDEGPQHKVRITKPFYMGVTEVTQGQWVSVMGTKPWTGKDYLKEGNDYPAVYVSWDEAVEYCEKMSTKENKSYRLPTEAEWEYACRGGTNTAYSFGSSSGSLKDYAWFDANTLDIGEKFAHTVGTKKANAFGLHDMHGNVYEWCSDLYDASAYGSRSGTTADPVSSSGSEYRVLRGGSWNDSSRDPRSAYRCRNQPDDRYYNLGFRVVR